MGRSSALFGPLIVLAMLPSPVAAQEARHLAPPEPVAVADSLFQTGHLTEAVGLYRSLVAANPEDGESAYLMGIALGRLGEWSEAADAFRGAARYRPRRGSALYRLGGALAQLGRADSSVAMLRRAVSAGFMQTGWLATDPRLDPLRERADFLALSRELFGDAYGQPVSGPPTVEEMRAGMRHVVGTIQRTHPNPFRTVDPEAWAARLAAAEARADGLDEEGYLIELMQLASLVGDVHTSVMPKRGSRVLRLALPVQFWKFADGLYVRSAARAQAELVGSKVLAIGGVDVEHAWPEMLERFPSENEWMAAYMAGFLLRFPGVLRHTGLGTDSTRASLRLRLPDGQVREITLEALDGGGYRSELGRSLGFRAPDGWTEGHAEVPAPTWLRERSRPYRLVELPDGKTLYFGFNSASEDSEHPWNDFLQRLVAKLGTTDDYRLVIDLRHNGGGWHYMAYDLVDALRHIDDMREPGRVVVLIGRLVQSAGVTIAAVLEKQVNAVFVGEPVGAHPNFFNGRWGNHPPLALPGTDIRFRVSVLEQQFSDPLDERRFIAPDVWVRPTYRDYAAGHDPVLEAALALSSEEAADMSRDPGGRPIEPYFRYERPSQDVAWPGTPKMVP
jgi:hypothetical protein